MKKIRFYEKSHTYWYGKKQLTSATTFIGKFFDKFDAKEVARKLAKFPHNKRNKRGVRYFLNEWKESAEYGSKVHKEIEEHLICSISEPQEPKAKKAIEWLDSYLEQLPNGLCEPEKIIYDEELGLAGTIDLTINRFQKKELTVDLIDWKTNKKITTTGYEGKKGTHEVTEDLDDCHLNKYGLQLSLYAYMLERQGCKIGELILVHLQDEDAVSYAINYDFYKPYIIKMLEVK